MDDLTEREKAVIRAMRESARAHKAIFKYATSFAGDDQAITPADLADEYETAYDDTRSD